MMRPWILGVPLAIVGAVLDGTHSLKPVYYHAPSHARITSHYIVGLKHSVSVESHLSSLLESFPALDLNLKGDIYPPTDSDTIRHTFVINDSDGTVAFEGFAGALSDDLVKHILQHPEVQYVEEDQIVNTQNHQGNAPWGLARLSHHSLPVGKNASMYSYDTHAGRGTHVYVIDTGIYCEHSDFEGRARFGINIVKTDPAKDLNGHGTHCAGTIAGKTFGVAKKAYLVAVKVLDGRGSGSMSDVVKGVEWTIGDHKRRVREASSDEPVLSAANMSLGGGKSPTLNRAVNAAVSAGIHFAVAAGNDDNDACLYSPASAPNPMTVGASTKRDSMAYFSNHGKCVDIFAPGHRILSTWIGRPDATNVLSGTSMASPHLAGLYSLYLSVHCASPSAALVKSGNCTTTAVKDAIVSHATMGVLRNLPDGKHKKQPDWPFPWKPEDPDTPDEGKTPNRLAFVIDEDEKDMKKYAILNNNDEFIGEDEEEANNMDKGPNGGYRVRLAKGLEGNPIMAVFNWLFG